MINDDDHKYMRLAIDESKNCKSEPGKVSPMVGAVVIKDGQVVAKAYRGEQEPGQHAEFIALEKKIDNNDSLAGATVYTTLEPCTTRGHTKHGERKLPCADRLVERKVARVVIGMLDPNPAILGKGQQLLRDYNIATALFCV